MVVWLKVGGRILVQLGGAFVPLSIVVVTVAAPLDARPPGVAQHDVAVGLDRPGGDRGLVGLVARGGSVHTQTARSRGAPRDQT